MSDLPTGWALVAFEDLFDRLQYGLTAKASADAAGTRFLRITDIDGGKINWDAVPGLNGGANFGRYLLSDGDFVFARSGSVEKAARILSPPNAVFASYLIRGRPIEPALGDWLAHFVWSTDYLAQIADRAAGIGMSNVSAEKLKTISVPLPPLAEQRRIVAKLDALTARTARARADLDRIPALATRYKQAVLDAAYDGRLSDSSFRALAVADVISSLDQGWSPKCDSEPAGAGQWGVIKTTAIQEVWFDASANKRLPEHLEPRPSIEIAAGDVLITRAGPRSRVGITCFVRHARDRLLLCDKAYRLRANPKLMDAEFLALMLNSPRALRSIEDMKTGISDSGLNLTQGKLLALSIPVPAVDEQKRLVAKIGRAFAEIDRMVSEAVAARRLLDLLNQVVLAKAFRGELVSQGAADEPASALLERIRAERASVPEATRGRRKPVA